MIIQTYDQMLRDVQADKQDMRFTADLERNMSVIRGRMVRNYKWVFSVYDGGDAERMIDTLRRLGYNASISDGCTMPHVKL